MSFPLDDWKDLGLDDEMDLWALEMLIMSEPKGPPVVPGTGGLRKLRFAPERWKTGKRGALRICYVYLEKFFIVLMVVAYGKSEKDDLTELEKDGIRRYIEKSEAWLSKRLTDKG